MSVILITVLTPECTILTLDVPKMVLFQESGMCESASCDYTLLELRAHVRRAKAVANAGEFDVCAVLVPTCDGFYP